MHSIDLPAGATVLLTATARPDQPPHRWDMHVRSAAPSDAGAHFTYGSEIGGSDCDQRIHVPRQDRDCRIEVTCGRAVGGGTWEDQPGSIGADTPSLLILGYGGVPPTGQADDVVLTFAFSGPARPATSSAPST